MFSISGIERWVFEPCWGSVSAPDRAGAWMRIRMFEAKDQRTLVRLFQRILGLEDTTNPSKSNRKNGSVSIFRPNLAPGFGYVFRLYVAWLIILLQPVLCGISCC